MDEATKPPEPKLAKFQGLQVFGRKDDQGRSTKIDAIDEDPEKIRQLGDFLQKRGYGVLRERNPRAGRVFYRLNAIWVGPGDAPQDPIAGG